MQTIDTLIHSRWIAPVEPDNTVYEHHSLAIRQGRILEILPTDQARNKYDPATEHALDGHLLIPGLVNAHTHAAMSLLRGLADDLPLNEWLNEDDLVGTRITILRAPTTPGATEVVVQFVTRTSTALAASRVEPPVVVVSSTRATL